MSLANIVSLQSQFNTLLSQQQTAYQTYINAVNAQLNTRKFLNYRNKTYNGTGTINTLSSISDVSGCAAECGKVSNCFGATYNTTSRQCTLASGQTQLVNSDLSSNYGIISETYYLYTQYTNLTNQVIAKYREIDAAIRGMSGYNAEVSKGIADLNTEIKTNYDTLLQQRQNADTLLGSYQIYDQKYLEQKMYVESQNTTLRMLTLVVCICIIVFININFADKLGTSGISFILFIFTIIVTLITITFYISSPSGFLILMIYFVIVNLIMLKLTGAI
jgi:PAN domain